MSWVPTLGGHTPWPRPKWRVEPGSTIRWLDAKKIVHFFKSLVARDEKWIDYSNARRKRSWGSPSDPPNLLVPMERIYSRVILLISVGMSVDWPRPLEANKQTSLVTILVWRGWKSWICGSKLILRYPVQPTRCPLGDCAARFVTGDTMCRVLNDMHRH